MSLQQFLREQAEQLRSPEAQRRRQEWVDSVERLVEQIRAWLAEADTEQILTMSVRRQRIREEGFLPYDAPGLDIELGGRTARVVPVARQVVGPLPEDGPFAGLRAEGRVDLVGDYGKYLLYRYLGDSGERWSIVDEDRYAVRPLDRDTFEHAIRRLLA